jgi:hypothetical protein
MTAPPVSVLTRDARDRLQLAQHPRGVVVRPAVGLVLIAVDVEVVTGAGVANVEVRHAPMDHVVADPTSASAAYAVRAG